MGRTLLEAPFPYFGGKSAVARQIWQRLGNVDHYLEPFFGSGAVLLGRPEPHQRETVNDINCYVVNFWRALKAEPDAVAEYADWPITEADLHARHRWLIESPEASRLRQRAVEDPHYYDVQIAGWWVWGISCWIGGGWCVKPKKARPNVKWMGVHKKSKRGCLREWFAALAQRLRFVNIWCGDWKRLVASKAVTTHFGTCGVFLDPPYGEKASRDPHIYTCDSRTVADEVRAWCVEQGGNPDLRICLAGYEGEHEELKHHGWDCVSWKANGGYANAGKGATAGKVNCWRERLWFSPGCIPPPSGFSTVSDPRSGA